MFSFRSLAMISILSRSDRASNIDASVQNVTVRDRCVHHIITSLQVASRYS